MEKKTSLDTVTIYCDCDGMVKPVNVVLLGPEGRGLESSEVS